MLQIESFLANSLQTLTMNKKKTGAHTVTSSTSTAIDFWFSPANENWTNPRFLGQLLLVFLVGFLLFSNTIKHEYVLDDTGAIEQNLNVQKGFGGIKAILTQDLWEFSEVRLGYYRPLSLITFAIEYEFFGKAPHVSHFNNVLLFGLSGIFLFLVLFKLFHHYNAFLPLIVTLLFLAHPIHTEVVANIKSRDEILSFLNVFVALYAFIRWQESGKKYWILVLFAFAYLGMLSKETALTGLLVAPLIAFIIYQKTIWESIKVALPFLVAIGLFFIQKRIALGSLEAIVPIDIINYPYVPPHVEEGAKFPMVFYFFSFGLHLLLLPYPLRYDYSYNQVPAVGFDSPLAAIGLILFVVGAIFAVRLTLRRSVYSLPLGIYFLSIVPSLAFTLLRGGIFAERFLFVPTLGFLLFGFILFKEILKKQNEKTRLGIRWGLFALLFVPYAWSTVQRNKVWHDNYTLFKTDLATGQNSAQNQRHFAEQSLVKAMAEKDTLKQKRYLKESMNSFYISVKMHPKFAESYIKMGVIHQLYLKNADSAIFYYKKCIACEPTSIMRAEAYYNLGTAYQNNKANLVYASYCYNQSLAFSPNYELAIVARDNLKKVGINQILEPIENDLSNYQGEKDANYYFKLGYDQAGKGDFNGAINSFNEVLKMNPTSLDALLNLANCYGMLKNYPKSIELNNRIIKLYPNDIRPWKNNVVNYEKTGNKQKMLECNDKVRKMTIGQGG